MRSLRSHGFVRSVSSGRVSGGVSAFVAFMLSMSMLLAGALVVLPVERAVADGLELGPDGYFSTLNAGATPVATGSWASTRRILFGKQKDAGSGTAGSTYGDYQVSGGYKTLAKGPVASESGRSFNNSTVPTNNWSASSTTSVASNEVLLWADDVVTAAFKFDTSATVKNSFDSETGSYKSNLATVSDSVGAQNYSVFEQGLLRPAKVEGVCTAAQSSGCSSGSEPNSTQFSPSINSYSVFPLSIGDVNKYMNHTSGTAQDDNLRCKTYIDNGKTGKCANDLTGSWFRSAYWSNASNAYYLANHYGYPSNFGTGGGGIGLRPALRLKLEHLLLSADSSSQGQSASGDLRLTFVDDAAGSLSGASATAEESRLTLSGSHGLSDGFGFKLVDPAEPTKVVASGLSASGVVDVSELPGVVSGTEYDVYWWGQENGSAANGWSNRATEPQKASLMLRGPSYGISLTGTTAGTLTAYRIGDYGETVFDHTGALRSVRLNTPESLGTVLKAAAESAGGSDVDADNSIGWVASRWLGYPTDPLSDDVTSAFSPYAGKLQLFAQQLAEAVKTDASALGAPAGSLTTLTDSGKLKVSGPGLYLIVDSSQDSGGSLPIIVGSKVFNEALGEEGSYVYVDFVDAGVKGKPRLGQAALKTSITDIAKRIVNDPGMDGFDVGSQVEYEITLRVPDLSGFTVIYDLYAFDVVDVAEPGLTLPAAGDVRVFMDVPAADTEVTGRLPSNSITVSGQTLSVTGLRSLFAGSGMTGVKNTVPPGSLMRIRYKAVLNTEHAEYSASGDGGARISPNVNTATLTRSKNDGGAEQMAATANAYTFEADVVKLDKDDLSRTLGGAQFEVSRARQGGGSETLEFVKLSDGVYRLAVGGETGSAVVVTKADGTLSLLGVEARELSFKETAAPSGYFRVSDFGVDIRPVWDADATQVTRVTYATSGTNLACVSQDGRQVMVLDPAWSLANLPYTGGMGILILLIIGGLILAFAVRPYVLSKRAERDANLV